MMALSIEFLHQKKIIHRDIKPENFLLTKDKKGRIRVKINDYDIAKRIYISPNTEKNTTKYHYSEYYASP
jgi:serine/threonine protein kinase